MRSRKEIVFPLLALILFSLLSAVGLELAVRVYHGALFSTDALSEPAVRLPDAGPLVYDAELGHLPGTGAYPRKGWSKSMDADGFRNNSAAGPVPGLPILAVGDSFTFGDEVEDHQSWPAQLEARLGRRVINAGVGGYGLDQAVLRAERVLAQRDLAAVVLGFISADVDRAAMSYRSFAKPYFDLQAEQLVLHNMPVPREPPESSSFNRALRHSYLARLVFRRIAPDWWHLDHRRIEHDRGLEVSIALVRRLHQRTAERGVPLLLVSLAGRERELEHIGPLLDAARAQNIPVLDLATRIVARADASPQADLEAFAPLGHLSPSSNAWVAEQLSKELGREFGELR